MSIKNEHYLKKIYGQFVKDELFELDWAGRIVKVLSVDEDSGLDEDVQVINALASLGFLKVSEAYEAGYVFTRQPDYKEMSDEELFKMLYDQVNASGRVMVQEVERRLKYLQGVR